MYAKAFLPDPEIPFLLITSREHEVLIPQLRALGWSDFGSSDRATAAIGEVNVSPDILQLIIGGQPVLVDDANPVAPDGWWPAVDRHRGHCW